MANLGLLNWITGTGDDLNLTAGANSEIPIIGKGPFWNVEGRLYTVLMIRRGRGGRTREYGGVVRWGRGV